MAWRALLLIAVGLALRAPRAAAQVVGAEHAASPAGHLAFVTRGNGFRATLRIVSPAGQIEPAETIGEPFDSPTVAIGSRGDAVVAWIDRQELWVRFRPAGGPLGPQELVTSHASTYIESLPLAVDGTGAVTTAWAPESGAGGLHVRTRDPATGWGRVQTLGGLDVYRPKLAVADKGSAVIAWGQHQRKLRNASQVAVASRLPGQPFGPPAVVAGIRRDPDYGRVATNDRGDAVVVWIETKHGPRERDVTFAIHGVFRAGGGAFGRRVALSRVAEATSPSVAVQSSGGIVLAWRDNSTHRVEARLRSPAGVLGRPRILTHALDLNTGPVALTAGRGVVAWSDDARRTRVLRIAQAGEDGRLAAPQVIARVHESFLDPAYAVSPAGLAVVATPPFTPRDPIGWQQVTLDQ